MRCNTNNLIFSSWEKEKKYVSYKLPTFSTFPTMFSKPCPSEFLKLRIRVKDSPFNTKYKVLTTLFKKAFCLDTSIFLIAPSWIVKKSITGTSGQAITVCISQSTHLS